MTSGALPAAQASLVAVASALLTAGLCVLPATAKKHPKVSDDPELDEWKRYQYELPLPDEIDEWFGQHQPFGIGIVCGIISGGLEVIDLDQKHDPSGTLNARAEAAIRAAVPGLWERLVIETTPSGGLHLYYHCPAPEHNLKLARMPNAKGKLMAVAETRGEGGFIVCAPSPGYVVTQGQLSKPPAISEEERSLIFAACRSLDQSPASPETPAWKPGAPRVMRPAGDVLPGDAYNDSDEWMNMVREVGWKTRNGNAWTRPDKDIAVGNSANWDTMRDLPRHFHCFSPNAFPLEEGETYTPFKLYAVLKCGGNFSQAAKELYAQGFGTRLTTKSPDAEVQAKLDAQNEASATANNGDHGTNGETEAERDARLLAGYKKRTIENSLLAPVAGPETETPKKVSYTVWKPAQFRDYTPPPNMNLLGAGYLRRRQISTLIGPPGVGKSRLSTWMGCCHIAGRPFLDLDCPNGPAKWLFFGNENDPLRQKTDLDYFYRQLTAEEQAKCDEYMHLHVLEKPDDGIITLADPEAYAKLIATLHSIVPDVIVFDPWGNMIEGNENDNEEVRRTLKLLLRAISLCCPNSSGLIIHHARTGKSTASEAGNNYSGGSLGRGSKALVSAARCELALWPGHSEDASRLVLTCEKVNNVKKFEPKGLLFKDGIYVTDPAFDLDAWKDDIAGIRSSGKTLTIDDLVQAVRSGLHKKKDLANYFEVTCDVAVSTVTRRLRDAVETGWLAPTQPPGSYTLGSKATVHQAKPPPFKDD